MTDIKENQTANAEAQNTARSELAEKIARWTGDENQVITKIPTLTLHRWETSTEPTSYMLSPSICMIAQGTKRVVLGEDTYVYDANHYLVNSVDLPIVAQILEAPYLGLTLNLDQRGIAQLMVDSNLPSPRVKQASRGMAVSEVPLSLVNAILRLIDLLDEPDDIPILAPMIQREILYRLLIGEQGARLRQIGAVGSHGHQIAQSIDWLKGNFDKPLRIEQLAADARMSASTFHHHFRAMTSMSPLQFQKWLRLNEARRLMLTEQFDAANASFQVGYESPSQFNREYKRQFGAPPLHDIKNLRQTATA